MTKKHLIFGSSLVTALLVLAGLLVLLAAPGTGAASTAMESGLPADHAAAYDRMLTSLTRTAPYLVAPREDVIYQEAREALGRTASEAQIRAAVDAYYEDFHLRNAKVSRPNPMAYLGRLKARELATQRGATDVNATAALTGTPEVLTVMTIFTGTTTFNTGPGGDPVLHQGICLTDTTEYPTPGTLSFTGPDFNEIPDPATVGDNWLAWIPDTSYTGGFSKEYYEKFMFSTEGYTDTFRPDLTNPWDGGSGYDFSGVSFKNYFSELSRGVYVPQGDVFEAYMPVSQAEYGANSCDGSGDDYFGPVWRIARDAADSLNAAYPGASTGSNVNFDWADWDVEDTFDYDNDGDFFEPDGYVDHFFIIYAGIGEHGGGGFLQDSAVWGHSWDVNAGPGAGPPGNMVGGYQVMTDVTHPLGGVWVLNYTVSDEGSGLGILVHEYGHDIGLPDNYGLDGSGPNPGLWDLMASGSWSGELASMRPAHMTIWDKEFLGWNSPTVLTDMSPMGVYTIGQQSIPPAGTIDGLRIDLPNKEIQSYVDPYGTNMWYSDMGDDRSEAIGRQFSPSGSEVVTITTQMAYDIEVDWDYLYWEISSTMTMGYEPLTVYSGTTDITTDTDPHGNNPSGKGITDSTAGWITAHAVIDSALHGNAPFDFRFRYFTDAAVQNEGIYLDNISVDGATSGNLFFDDAEGGDLWTHMSEGINSTKPWLITDGFSEVTHYYLVEWRNAGEPFGTEGPRDTATAFAAAGFDLGLNRTYWIDGADDVGNVTRAPFHMNAPGMVVWYVNNSYESNNINVALFDDPWGAKGRVLAVDANPYPFFVDDATGPRTIGERRSAFDAAYTLDPRAAFTLTSNLSATDLTDTTWLSVTTVPGADAVPAFHDRIGVYPGIAFGFFVDFDAGVMLPTVDDVPYWPAWVDFGDTGNPGVNAFGVNLEVLDQAPDGTYGVVKFYHDKDTVFVSKDGHSDTAMAGETLTYTIRLKDASGSRYSDSLWYTFTATLVDKLPSGTTYVPGSATVVEGANSPASTLGVSGDVLFWTGVLGGNLLHESDAVIQYAVTVDTAPVATGCTTLHVNQEWLFDDFHNGGLPFVWPEQPIYWMTGDECHAGLWMPRINK